MNLVSTAARRAGGILHVIGDGVNRHFAAAGAFALLVAIAGLIALAHVVVGGDLRATEERGATTAGVVLARSAFESAIIDDSGRLNRAEVARLDAATAGARTAQGLVGLTVFAPSGRVLYSPDHGLIGTRQRLDRYQRAAFERSIVSWRREVTTGPTDTSDVPRIDVQVPLESRGRVVALFELALPYAPIDASVSGETRQLDVALLVFGLIIFLLAFPRIRQAGAALRTVATQQHQTLVRDLRHALGDHRQLRLEYQPLAQLRTGRVRAVEALLRWDHPRRGSVPPAEFIPQIEQTALIWPLTVHVLELAIRQAVAWRAEALDLRVSVNIAAPCLLDPRLAVTVAELLDRSGLPADRLAIELTEQSVMSEPEAAVEALLALRALGIEVLELDDFGTGYSSLTRLRDLPISGLKIDRRFVIDAGVDGDPTMIAAITELAHKFGLSVVAEGMEDEAIWDRMAVLGCDVGQGYWLSRPLRPGAVQGWMRGHAIEQWPQPRAVLELGAPGPQPLQPRSPTRRYRPAAPRPAARSRTSEMLLSPPALETGRRDA
jgi:EAL domain-containing protein (putative c-di-GMP-specific phosphodiesterase class I)